MRIKHIFLGLIFLISFSCEGILEEKPKGFIAPSQYFNTEGEVEAAIFGVYNFLNRSTIAEYEWFFMGDYGTDVTKSRTNARYAYQYGDMETIPATYATMWRDYYQAIGAANMVVARVAANEDLDADFRKRIIAEAKFIRAFCYLHLNLVWGNVPVWIDELNLDEVEKLGTSSSSDVKIQIILDLTVAANVLPSSVSEVGRVTSWAAKGLLARVYLFNNQWQLAKDMAKDVIDNSGHMLLSDYYDVFDFHNENNIELIHVVPKIADIKPSRLHSHSSPRPFDDNNKFEFPDGHQAIRPDGQLSTDKKSRNPGSLFQGWGTYQCFEEHYNSFTPGDTRKDLWWHVLEFTDSSSYTFTGGGSIALNGHSGYYNLKWIAWDEAPNNGGRDIILQRLSELYLIYAEAENELHGPTGDAYEAINTIRRRAFGNQDNDLSGLSKEEFLEAIRLENRLEFGGEGLRRWYLWHWGYDVYLAAAQSVKVSNPALSENIKPHHMYFRILDEEILKNPNLLQNPGYQ